MTSFCLLLACLLVPVSLSVCQSVPPAFIEVTDDRMIRVDLTKDSIKTVECPDSPGFIGVSDRRNSRFVSRIRSFGIDLAYKRGDVTDMGRVRNTKLGAYHCLYRQSNGDVTAYAFVISEFPKIRRLSWRLIRPTEITHLVCPTLGGNITWERYDSSTGLYKISQRTNTRIIALTFTQLQASRDGFTSYRCYSDRRPENMHYYGIESSSWRTKVMRHSNFTSTILPIHFELNSRVRLNCEGDRRQILNSAGQMFHKRDGRFVKVNESQDSNFDFEDSRVKSVSLVIKNFTEKYSGIYKCTKDGVNQMVNLVVDFGAPILLNPGLMEMTVNNTAVCSSSVPSTYSKVYFVVKRLDLSPLILRNGSQIDGFKVEFDRSNRLLLNFIERDDMINGVVECWLENSRVRVTYRLPDYRLVLTSRRLTAGRMLQCRKNAVFGSIRNFTLTCYNGRGASVKVKILRKLSNTLVVLLKNVAEFVECVCEAKVRSSIVRSNIVTVGDSAVHTLSFSGKRMQLAVNNSLLCTAPMGNLSTDLNFVVRRPGKVSLALTDGDSEEGFSATRTKGGQLKLNFLLRKDMDEAAVDCQLFQRKLSTQFYLGRAKSVRATVCMKVSRLQRLLTSGLRKLKKTDKPVDSGKFLTDFVVANRN